MILLFSSVGLWRQQLRPDARVHGIIQEGGTAANIIPDRTQAWFMLRSAGPGLLRGDEGALPRAARGRRARDRDDGRGDVLGRRDDDAPEPDARGPLGRERGRLRRSSTRAPTRTPAAPTWATSAGSARRSTPSSRSATRARRATRSCSATPPRRRAPTRRPSWRRRSSPRPPTSCSPTPTLVEAAWREFRGEA